MQKAEFFDLCLWFNDIVILAEKRWQNKHFLPGSFANIILPIYSLTVHFKRIVKIMSRTDLNALKKI